jgi:HNH endonuclease
MPAGIYKRKSLEDRFWSNVNKNGPIIIDTKCWEWTAGLKDNGYGQTSLNKKKFHTHRLSWEMHNGPIPENLQINHRCNNRKCVNPEHLILGTQQENVSYMNFQGRHALGQDTGMAVLTEAQVKDIRQKYRDGVRNCELCREYKVSNSTIHRVVFNKLWKHVT